MIILLGLLIGSKSLLINLLLIEGLMIVIFISLYCTSMFTLWIILIILTVIVAEGCLGMAVLINLSRKQGEDIIYVWTRFKDRDIIYK